MTIPITVSAGAATEADDYAVSGLTSEALSFAVGDTSQTITITANEDTDSADESVELGFGTLPTGVILGTQTTATVALADNDPLTVELSGPTETVDDAFEVTITFSEEVSGFEASEVSVGGGTAALSGSGGQYTAAITPSASGTVTVDVAAGVAQAQEDAEDNAAAAQFSVLVQFTCTTGAAVADPATDTDLVSDCEALRGAKDELAGTGTLNWSADLAISSWDGVSVGGTPSRVTELGLADEGLNGVVPAALGGLGGLTVVELQGNQLSGCIPTVLKTQLDSTSDLGGLQYCDAGPGKPGAPTVVAGGASSVVVSWEEPVNEGAAISDFDVQYRQGSSGSFTSHSFTSTGSTTATTITGLLPGRSYEAQVRATSTDGTSPWSESGTGQTEALAVSYGAGSYTASEGGAAASVVVELSPAAEEAVTIPITVSAGAATEADDYAVNGLTSDALSFAVGDTSQTLTITANEDADSADESVELGFGTLPTGVALGTVSSATVGLADNDPLTVSLSGPTETVDDAFEVTITFSEEVSGFEASEVSVGGGTATLSGSGAEYTAAITPSASGTVTVDVAAGVAQALDDGEASAAAAQFSVLVQFTCTTGAAVADPATDTDLVSDCETLLAARDTLAGDGTLNWSADLAMSSWAGVTVAGTPSRVTRLSVSRQLSGSIPSGLGDLSGLSYLSLVNNELSGSIPSDLGELTNLTRLDLGGNELDGSIPTAFGSLTGLTELYLDDNELSGAIPSEVGAMEALTTLSLESNELSGNVPSELGDLESLTALELQDNRLSGCIPTALETQLDSTQSDLGGLQYCDAGPGRPLPATVTAGGPSSLSVGWSAPVNEGTAISDFDVQYRQGSSGSYTSHSFTSTGSTTATTISGLLPGRSYEVQVRATSSDGSSPWSPSTTAATEALVLSFAAATYEATEGGSVGRAVVTLSSGAVEAVTIGITATAVSGTEGSDYTITGLTEGAVTFAVGGISKTVIVRADEDDDSADEAVVLGFGTLPMGVVTDGTSLTSTQVTLADDDPLTVELSGPTETVDDGFEVTITFSEEVSGFEASEVSVGGGTATLSGSGADYTATIEPSASGTVTVDVAAGVVQDEAGNANEAAAQFSVLVQFTCTTGAAVADPVTDTELVSDCEQLLGAQETLAGDGTLNWSADVALTSWEGVTVSGTPSRVTGLGLASKQLSGSIASGLGSVSKLASLSLYDNALTGSIPSELRTLTSLTALNLGSNELSGSIPATLGNLTNLTSLSLAENELSGSIPSEVGSLTQLTVLSLHSNDLSGNVPSELGNIYGLWELTLNDNRLSGCIPTVLDGVLDSSASDLGGLQYCDLGPGRPLAPSVTSGGATSLSVSWSEPVNEGSAISDFDVQYREGSSGGFTSHSFSSTGSTTSTTVSGLLPGRSYEVQVRATSMDGTSPWSPAGSGQSDSLTVTYGAAAFEAVEGGSSVSVTVVLSAAAVGGGGSAAHGERGECHGDDRLRRGGAE